MKKSLRYGCLLVQLDRSQVFPDDPGQGTPAIVRRFKYTATYWCASSEGVLVSEFDEWKLSDNELEWLASIDGEVTDFLYK